MDYAPSYLTHESDELGNGDKPWLINTSVRNVTVYSPWPPTLAGTCRPSTPHPSPPAGRAAHRCPPRSARRWAPKCVLPGNAAKRAAPPSAVITSKCQQKHWSLCAAASTRSWLIGL